MSQHDILTLTQALQQIADWNSHTTEYAVDYGSNGVRDFYRNIARAALATPAQAQQTPYAWAVSGASTMFFGPTAEYDARQEAKHCGGTAEAFPLFKEAQAAQGEPTLRDYAESLVDAGHDFWKACNREVGGGAVRWLSCDDGTLIVFTRCEYRDAIMRNVGGYKAPEVVFAEDGMTASEAQAAQPEPLVRFCPGCGSVGEVPDSFKDCCPDGGHARMIPESLARRCHDLFRLALDSAVEAQAQQAGEVVALPLFDELDDEAIDEACAAGSIYRADFMRAWNALRDWRPYYTTPPAPAQPAPVVPDGWKLVDNKDGSITVSTPAGGAVTLWRKGQGSVESIAYRLAQMLLTASTTPPAQQPEAVPSEQARWCAYVGGMVAHWVKSEPDAPARLSDDEFEAAIAGIIERRLWALRREPAPKYRDSEDDFDDAIDAAMASSARKGE